MFRRNTDAGRSCRLNRAHIASYTSFSKKVTGHAVQFPYGKHGVLTGSTPMMPEEIVLRRNEEIQQVHGENRTLQPGGIV
jgi:hypothetical protein